MSSTEITNLQALRDALADLAQWVTWTGLATSAARKERIGLPELEDSAAMPAMVIDLLSGFRANAGASDSSASFRPYGRMVVSIFDVDPEGSGDPLTDRYLAFADKFFQIIDELTDIATDGAVQIGNIAYPDGPIQRTPVNLYAAQDTNDNGIDDATTVPIWFGTFTLNWGDPQR